MSKIKLKKQNPGFHSPEDLDASFVVRQPDLELLVETIRENTGKSNQHMLIIGPRGMGKTMLVLRTASYISKDSQLNSKWYPVVFGEEDYEIFTAGEFWLWALFHIGRQTGDPGLLELHNQLIDEHDDKRLYERALSCLMDFADTQNKRLLLVVENLNMLLDEQIGADQCWDIRHTLLNEPRIMLLATAPTRFDAIDKSGQAMYDLFKIHPLDPLNTEECRELWHFLTGQEMSSLKIRPLKILTGGNPRLLAILSTFSSSASIRDLMELLTGLIDDYTNYFKGNIETLPALERKIFVTLLRIWEPATTAQVARNSRIPVNKVSSLLKRLQQRGCITQVNKDKGKRSYQATERLYNIYYLMRLSGRKADRVRAVVEFMIKYYEEKELLERIGALAEEACGLKQNERLDHFDIYNEILLTRKSKTSKDEIISSTNPAFFQLPDTPMTLKDMFESYQTNKALTQVVEEVINNIEANGELDTVPLELLMYGVMQRFIGNLKESEKALRKSANALPHDPLPRMLLGAIYYEKQQYEEAEEACRTALEIEPGNIRAQLVLASIHGKQENWDDALSVAAQFISHESSKDYIKEIIHFFIDAAAAGFASRSLQLLEDSPNSGAFEPLIVALKIDTGQKYNAPLEVTNVAEDLLEDINKKRSTPPGSDKEILLKKKKEK